MPPELETVDTSVKEDTSTKQGLTSPEVKEETVADALARLRSSGVLRNDSTEDSEDESTITDETDSDKIDDTKEEEASKIAEAKKSEALKVKSEKILTLFPDGEEDAEIASKILDKFSGNEFKANEFLTTLEGVSKKRVSQLKAELKTQVIEEAKTEALKELGLEGVTSTDYQMFKRFLDAGGSLAMLGDLKDDDIPESLKVDGNGNPLSDEHIEFFKDIKKQLKKSEERANKLEERLNARDKDKVKSATQKLVNDFSAERIASLDSVMDDLKLTDEQNKQFIAITIDEFSRDEKLVKLWADALEANRTNDGIMARKLSRQVDIGLTKIAEKTSKLFSNIVKAESKSKEKELEAAKEERKEISESGGAVTKTGRTKFRINPDKPFDVGDAQKQFAQMQKDGVIRSR